MIAAAELRIGNWIDYHYDDEDSGGNMRRCSDFEQVESGNCIQNVIKYPEDYEPILLTPAVMASCGFTESSNGYWRHYELPNHWIISEWLRDDRPAGFEEKGVYYWGDPYVPVRWLHQLQNLYFALTRKELEVKL